MPCACCNGRSHSQDTFDPFIDPTELATRLPLDNGGRIFALPFLGPDGEAWNSCRLQALPTECYQTCLQYLDIANLTKMRRVSQFTRSTIDSMPQYRDLYEHAPQALRACLSTGVASHIPLLRLHESLITMECYYCKISYVLPSQFIRPEWFPEDEVGNTLSQTPHNVRFSFFRLLTGRIQRSYCSLVRYLPLPL
jgi:hypothetical protein